MINKNILLSISLTTALFLGACASSSKHDASQGGDQAGGGTTSGYNDGGLDANAQGGGGQIGADDARTAAERQLTNNVVYFEYDSSSIKAEYQAVVDAYARYLVANPASKVRLEGHTDERGTREYNVSLGERRANAVRDALAAAGVTAAQVSVLSYGEERPAASGHDEAAYSQNRRVQIIRQ